MTEHQRKQIEVIDAIESQIRSKSLLSTTIAPIPDFESDQRMTLTAVHYPSSAIRSYVLEEIVRPLRQISPDAYYSAKDCLHMTIKNVRAPNDPPRFTPEDAHKAEDVFAGVIPSHSRFNVYFYRLLLFPNSLAMIGTTDPELDNIIFDLDNMLNKAGIADDKKYVNTSHFFINMSLARFVNVSAGFVQKVDELSSQIKLEPYQIDNVSLVTGNSVLRKANLINRWNLK